MPGMFAHQGKLSAGLSHLTSCKQTSHFISLEGHSEIASDEE